MTEPSHVTDLADAALLTELAAVVTATDALPVAVRAGALGAFGWLNVDAELADLLADSAEQLAGSSAGPARGAAPTDARLLTFGAGDVVVEVEISGTGDRLRMVGQVVPPQQGPLVVRSDAGAVTTQADELGRFVADGVPPGPVSLVVARSTGHPLVTPWTVV